MQKYTKGFLLHPRKKKRINRARDISRNLCGSGPGILGSGRWFSPFTHFFFKKKVKVEQGENEKLWNFHIFCDISFIISKCIYDNFQNKSWNETYEKSKVGHNLERSGLHVTPHPLSLFSLYYVDFCGFLFVCLQYCWQCFLSVRQDVVDATESEHYWLLLSAIHCHTVPNIAIHYHKLPYIAIWGTSPNLKIINTVL